MKVSIIFILFSIMLYNFIADFVVILCQQKNGANAEIVDINKTTMTLEPEKSTGGGLYVPGKDRVVYVAPERKSRLGIAFFCNSF